MSKHTDILLEAVHEIAEIIYMEMHLEYQDVWLQRVIDKGIWRPEVGTCCRNGCEKCEQ